MMKISIHKDMVEMGKIRSNDLVYLEFSSPTIVKHFSIKAVILKKYNYNFEITVEMNHS